MHKGSGKLLYWTIRLALLVMLAAIIGWQWQQLLNAAPRYIPERISVELEAGALRLLGQKELAAVQAESNHIRLRRDATGAWWLANAAESHAVEIRKNGRDELLRTQVLLEGMNVTIGSLQFAVIASAPDLTLRDHNQVIWRFDGQRLRRNGIEQTPCPDSRWFTRYRSLEIGGLLDCGNRVANAGLPEGFAKISRNTANNYVLQGNSSLAARSIRITNQNEPGNASLFEQEVPLIGISSMVVGRSNYLVSQHGNTLNFIPKSRVQAFASAAPEIPGGVRWQMKPLDHWQCSFEPKYLLAVVLLLIGAGSILVRRGRYDVTAIQAINLAAALMLSAIAFTCYVLSCYLGWMQFGAGWALLLESICLATLLFFRPAPGVLATLGLSGVLLAFGLATQQALGLESGDSGGLRYFISNACLCAMSMALVAAWFAWRRIRRPTKAHGLRNLEMGLVGLALIAIALLVWQVISGTEAGVGGIQPIEFAKMALVLLSAHALALCLGWSQDQTSSQWRILLRFAMPLVLFLGAISVALWSVRDFSPFVLLTTWLVISLLAWTIANRSIAAFIAAVLISTLLACGITSLKTNGNEWLASHGFYSERVNVWLQLRLHPHNGEQVRRGGELAMQGGLTGQPTAHGWRVPVVQNDFAPVYLLARFGAIGGMAMFALQGLLLAALLSIGYLQLHGGAGDYRTRWACRMRFFALWGWAGLLLGHFITAWGTNLQWLPVMGQPMPYLSYAGSLITCFITPLQWMVATADQSPQEE
jgi:cell division protein FtsW